jgi:predicted RNA binding protein YcfA (HicA-like mRNA interferase family)
MSRLPSITPREMLSALQKAGFFIVRSKGSHHYLKHRNDPGRRTTVAVHPGDLPVRDLMEILKQAKLSREEFLKLL